MGLGSTNKWLDECSTSFPKITMDQIARSVMASNLGFAIFPCDSYHLEVSNKINDNDSEPEIGEFPSPYIKSTAIVYHKTIEHSYEYLKLPFGEE